MTTDRHRDSTLRSLAGLLLAAVLAVLTVLLPATAASAAPRPAAENSVGVIHSQTIFTVGVHESITAGGRRVRGPSQLQTVVGHCVAAEAGDAGSGGGAETFYRTMSKDNFAELQSTGRVPATSETFVSPSAEFSSGYEGQMVQFSVRPGTTSALEDIGVRDSSAVTQAAYPDMPMVSSGWASTSAFFKGEGGIINIGLGQGPALDTFNDAIMGFREVP